MTDEASTDDVASYDRFSKVDGATYERVNGFLRERTYVTAREWRSPGCVRTSAPRRAWR